MASASGGRRAASALCRIARGKRSRRRNGLR
jgi:hypothetical protein